VGGLLAVIADGAGFAGERLEIYICKVEMDMFALAMDLAQPDLYLCMIVMDREQPEVSP
jgi:hypothetical protein